MAGARDFAGLMATRFLLGAFEAAIGKQDPHTGTIATTNVP